ncbi:heterokaryon incompatibility protein-domain-containing protein [Cercophora samala]|uniref:Heterokaryon incompatibility protein-domain-containing protein n=1 Tax=Cercophora samala TaxID=330535 RepID=A0AA40CWE3_9PEZI|nr:heterokaryon incompatibility protein-domain-containing protein [Cercophora samala]
MTQSDRSESLCGICQEISLDQMGVSDDGKMQRHQPTYLALKQSMEKGCVLCRFIWDALGRDISREGDRGADALAHVSNKYPGREISLVAWPGVTPTGYLDRIQIITSGEIPDVDTDDEADDRAADPSMHPDHQFALSGVLDIFAYPDDAAAWHGGVTGRPLPTTDGSSDTDCAFATGCLQQCLSKHVGCGQPGENPLLPTRVLDLEPSDGSQLPYLLHTNGLRGQYSTLSHCWGGHVPITTRSDNIEEHKKAVSNLPPTFRDAVHISRRLGIRYLWIDSLCILQDSKEDWEKESAKMGEIYKLSVLTIAARAARNAMDGCFLSRSNHAPACQLEYRSSDGQVVGSIYVRDPLFEIERLTQTPLDSRGWVLQEKLLSPRILYYGAQQLYWECRQTSVRQDGKYHYIQQDAVRHAMWKERMDIFAPFQSVYPNFNRIPPDWTEARHRLAARMRQWYNLVEEYSSRQLTYDTDKLPAIAGIAKEWAKSAGLSYVAGLWREDILAGLLWYRGKEATDPPVSSTLPSWSWARYRGKLNFWAADDSTFGFSDYFCEFVNLSFRPSGALGSYGDVVEARLELRGRVLPVRHATRISLGRNFLVGPNIVGRGGEEIGVAKFDTSLSPSDELFVLPVHAGVGDVGYGAYYAAGLLLSPVGTEEDTFRRVGYVNMERGHGEGWFDTRSAADYFQDIATKTLFLI